MSSSRVRCKSFSGQYCLKQLELQFEKLKRREWFTV